VSFDVGPSNLSPETEEILRRAREGERMPNAHKRRLKGAVLARIAFTGTATLAAGQATAKMGGLSFAGSLAAKTVVGVAILGTLGTGGYLALRPARQPAPVVARPVLEPRVEASPVEVVVEEPVAIEAPLPAPAPAPRHRTVVRRAPPPPPPPAADLAEETRLLRDADKALRAGAAAKAIALLDEHAARFPKGALAPERTAERLIVSCELGVADRARVDQFLASRGASPLAARVRRACAPK
jgi:hypothetical protein